MSLRLGSPRAWRITLGLLALLSFAAAVPLTVLSHQAGDGVVAAVIGIPCTVVGWAVARRQPGNPLGWLFLFTGLFMFLATAGGDYGYLVYRQGHHLPFAPAGLTAVDHPAGWFAVVQITLGLAIVVLTLAFITRQALSWRRAAGDRRQQLKWLASGAAVSITCLFVATAFSTPGKAVTLAGWIGVAILKYRLYEIDRIVSRTLAYAIVTGLLVGVYAGLVLLATEVLRFHSTVAVAASTLAAAALFSPVRRWVQHAVDRRWIPMPSGPTWPGWS